VKVDCCYDEDYSYVMRNGGDSAEDMGTCALYTSLVLRFGRVTSWGERLGWQQVLARTGKGSGDQRQGVGVQLHGMHRFSMKMGKYI
jgi:hypothetical protein